MNLEQLQKELAADEGCKLEIYLDHLGYPTVGIGHLITENDELYGFEVGSEVSQEHVDDKKWKNLSLAEKKKDTKSNVALLCVLPACMNM